MIYLRDGEKFLFIEGGKGGLGNVHFKNSRNQRPTYFQPGLPGITKNIRLELKTNCRCWACWLSKCWKIYFNICNIKCNSRNCKL
jgi:hypothetical protein